MDCICITLFAKKTFHTGHLKKLEHFRSMLLRIIWGWQSVNFAANDSIRPLFRNCVRLLLFPHARIFWKKILKADQFVQHFRLLYSQHFRLKRLSHFVSSWVAFRS